MASVAVLSKAVVPLVFIHCLLLLLWVRVRLLFCYWIVCVLSSYFVCFEFAMPLCACVYLCLVVTCWERADLFVFIRGVLLLVCHFPIGILGPVWYLIVSIPDLCTLTHFCEEKAEICIILLSS